MPGERAFLQCRFHLSSQSLEATPHVGDTCSNPDTCACRQANHARNASKTACTVAASAAPSILTLACANVIWMNPQADALLPMTGLDASISRGRSIALSGRSATMCTGRNFAAAAGTASSRPARYWRRQRNNMLTLMPCVSAIFDTDTSATDANAASLLLNSTA